MSNSYSIYANSKQKELKLVFTGRLNSLNHKDNTLRLIGWPRIVRLAVTELPPAVTAN